MKHAARAISQAAKKVKAFEAMTITRNLKQRREKLLAVKDGDAKDTSAKVAALEATCVADLARVKGLDVKEVLLPRALAKLGLDATLLEATKESDKEKDKGVSSSGDKSVDVDSKSSKSAVHNISGVSDSEPVQEGGQSHEETAVAAPLDSATEALVARLLNHTAMKAAIESMNPAVTLRRCEKLAKAEGRRFSKKEMAAPDSSAGISAGAAPAVNHRAARTTFLTSLSGDAPAEDSDASDDDDDEYGAAPQVKNRPGQRARQKRHELEEARKAKKEAKKRAAAGQQPSDHASSSNVPPSQRGINPLSKAGRSARESSSSHQQPALEREQWSLKRGRDDNSSDQKPKKKKSENAIHASWEAAKLRREKEAARMVVPAQGMKIVFGEDGGVTAARSSTPTNTSATPRAAVPTAAVAAAADKQHPSWAAKQAQQAKLAAGFQGKKTTFG